jgi:hypothetical protein
MMNFKLDFITQYNQFYLGDKSSTGDTASDSFWTDAAFRDRLAVEDGILGIGTECYGHVKGELNILDNANEEIDFEKSDHVVEGSLEVKSGVLQVMDYPNCSVELEVEIRRGIYNVRVYSSGLTGIYNDEMEEEGGYYRIKMWPGTNVKRSVLKEFVL